jgi:hypothetical protein
MSEVDNTNLKIIPAPTGGWNTRDPIHAMPETDAIELVNYFPQAATVVNRGGSTKYCDVDDLFGGTHSTAYFFQIFGLENSSGAFIIALVNDTYSTGARYIYRCNTATGVWSDITASLAPAAPANSPPYDSCVFRGRLFIVGWSVNISIAGTGDATASSWTGPAAALLNVTSYNRRLFFTENGTQNIWYAGIDAITGALTQYDISSLLTGGGTPIAIGSTSKQGTSNQNLFVVVSNKGEVLVFQGDYPGSATWGVVGRYFIARPAGRCCLCYRGASLHIITERGVIPVNTLLAGDTEVGGDYKTSSAKIDDAFIDASDVIAMGTRNWMGIDVPIMKGFIVSGIRTDTTNNFQAFVQNTTTGAWCKWDHLDGDNFIYVNGKVYYTRFNTSHTIKGFNVLELGIPGTSGGADWITTQVPSLYGALESYTSTCRLAFNYLDDPTHNKHITSVKAFFDLVQEAGHDTTKRQIKIGADSDFGNANITNQCILQAVATDGTVHYVLPTDVQAQGTSISIIFNSSFGAGYILKWNLFVVNFESGGFLS